MTYHILVIDDNEADHVIAQYAIDELAEDVQLHSAYDGQEALNMLDAMDKLPDVIFVDISMPGMNGHEFLAAYAARNDICSVIVMLTSSDQSEDKVRCMNYPFVKDYLVKPLESSYLEFLIASLK